MSDRLFAVLAVLIVSVTAFLALALAGCSPSPAPAGTGPGTESAAPEHKSLADLLAERDKLKGDLAAKNQEIDNARVEARRRGCQITAAGLGVLSLACVVLAWLLKSWKAGGLAVVLAALAAVVLTVGSLAAWWEWIGGAVLLLAIAASIIALVRERKHLATVVGAVQEFKDNSRESWAKAKPIFSMRISKGLEAKIDRLLGRPAKG